jgi:hypothetical protein
MIMGVFVETFTRVFWISIVVIPLLLLVEWLNHKYGDKLITFFEKRERFMPFWAGLLAMLPGCNVAAAIALLYAKGLVSMGALIAAMIATSDEALYVFIPQKFNFLPLFGAKLILAVLVGFLIDYFTKKISLALKTKGFKVGYCCSIHEHVHNTKEMIIHVLRHGSKIIFFIFIVLFSFNLLKDLYGFEAIANSVLLSKTLQPAIAGLVGLLPGCGTSVVIATLYTQGILSFGGALAGLAVASGDTLLVLLANKVPRRELLYIVAIVLSSGVLTGYAINGLLQLINR